MLSTSESSEEGDTDDSDEVTSCTHSLHEDVQTIVEFVFKEEDTIKDFQSLYPLPKNFDQ